MSSFHRRHVRSMTCVRFARFAARIPARLCSPQVDGRAWKRGPADSVDHPDQAGRAQWCAPATRAGLVAPFQAPHRLGFSLLHRAGGAAWNQLDQFWGFSSFREENPSLFDGALALVEARHAILETDALEGEWNLPPMPAHFAIGIEWMLMGEQAA